MSPKTISIIDFGKVQVLAGTAIHTKPVAIAIGVQTTMRVDPNTKYNEREERRLLDYDKRRMQKALTTRMQHR